MLIWRDFCPKFGTLRWHIGLVLSSHGHFGWPESLENTNRTRLIWYQKKIMNVINLYLANITTRYYPILELRLLENLLMDKIMNIIPYFSNHTAKAFYGTFLGKSMTLRSILWES